MQSLIVAGRMAQVSAAAAVASREATPASDSDSASQTPGKRRDISVDHGLHLELDDVFKLMDFLEKEGLQVLSADLESTAAVKLQVNAVKPPPKVDSEAGVLSRVRSNDPGLCPPKLDLSKSRLNFVRSQSFVIYRCNFNKALRLVLPSHSAALITVLLGWLMMLGFTRRCESTPSWSVWKCETVV